MGKDTETNGTENPRNSCICEALVFDRDSITESTEKKKLEKLFIHKKKMKLDSFLHQAKISTPDG